MPWPQHWFLSGPQRPGHFKIVSDPVGRGMYGYRFLEVDPHSLNIDKTNVKKDLKITRSLVDETHCPDRLQVSRTLPVYFTAALPRPCPNYPPNLVIALLKRAGTQPPKSSKIVLQCLSNFAEEFCKQYLTPLKSEDCLTEEWIEQINQPTHRKDACENAGMSRRTTIRRLYIEVRKLAVL